jgi:hypothetical protein
LAHRARPAVLFHCVKPCRRPSARARPVKIREVRDLSPPGSRPSLAPSLSGR